MKAIVALLFAIGLSWPNFISAQQPLYRHIGLSEGLMSHAVYSTFQDRDGYIWFATDEGACRYDGIEFTYFTTDNGLCDNEVLQIRQDSKGRIWLLTLSGCLCYFKDGQMFNASNDQSLIHAERTIGFTGITEDGSGDVFIFGLSNSVLRYNGKSIRPYRFFPEYKVLPTITFSFTAEDGNMCFLNQGYVFEFKNDELVDTHREQMKYSRPNCVTRTPLGPTVISLDGLHVFNNKHDYVLAAPEVFEEWEQFISINYFRGSYWFCLKDGGVEEWRLDNGQWTRLQRFLSEAVVNSVIQDREENLWFSTRDKGVYFLPYHTFGQNFYPLDNPYQVTAMVHVPERDMYLVGIDNGDIWSLEKQNNYRMERYVQPDKKVGLERMVHMDDGRVLCINHQGVYWVERGKLTPLDDSLNLEIPKSMTLDGKGGAYVAALIHCIHVPDLSHPHEWHVIRSIPNERIYHLAVDHEGRLWFEQHDKLYCYHAGNVKPHEAFNLMCKGRISDIQVSDDGRLVVATYGSGVFVLQEDRIAMQFDSQHGLNSNECKFIMCNGKQLYLHTSAGLWLVDCTSAGDHKPHLINAFDNLANKKLFEMTIGTDQFYFGTHTGLYSAPLFTNAQLRGPTEVVLESLNQMPLPHLDMQSYRFDYGQHISIEFTSLCLGWSKDLEFEYRLSNLDTNWIATKVRTVDFSQLQWGTNVFQVRSRHPHSNWTQPQTMILVVEAPFYASWWFRSLVFILALSITYYVVQNLIKRRYNTRMEQMERDRLVLAERNRISADLHDEIGAEVSNIVILSRIAQAKVKNNDSPIGSIEKIDRAANDMINKMNGIIWSLNPANDDLVTLVEYLKRYGNDYFELHSYTGGVAVSGNVRNVLVKGIVRRNIFLILKEALQNIHKHAQATEVQIKISVESRALHIEVIDNGVGFDVAHIKRGRLGLTSLQKRANDIGGSIEITPILGVGTTIKASFALN